MTDETINKIKQVNQRLSELVGLPYTDFYSTDRFVMLFDLPLENYSRHSTISELVLCTCNYGVFNRFTFISKLCDYIDYSLECRKLKLSYRDKELGKLIRAIQREFRGLGENG